MPRDHPHPLSLFSLVPLNEKAMTVLSNPENSHLVTGLRWKKNSKFNQGLGIGQHIGSSSCSTLATIGRGGDILIEGTSISRIQCSFEIQTREDSKDLEIFLQDRSSNFSTCCFGKEAQSFQSGRPHRRVLIDPWTNLEFGFGGVDRKLFQFKILWHDFGNIESRVDLDIRVDNPRNARTLPDEPPTAGPSIPITRVHTPGQSERLRYSERGVLGKGSFGEVFRIVNVDSGEHLALKRIPRPDPQSRDFSMLKREVETLARMRHKNIIEYKIAQWTDDDMYLELATGLKIGSVETLVQKGLYIQEPSLMDSFLHQMLQALDYLESQNVIHRDIKPANILYTPPQTTGGNYLYQLADFGLANVVGVAKTYAGSPLYMAPELNYITTYRQTPKMDIWSLFVTLAEMLNADGFCTKPQQTISDRLKAIREAACEEPLCRLRSMAKENPTERISAGELLQIFFQGGGRTTRPQRGLSVAQPPTTIEVVTDQVAEGSVPSIQTTDVLGSNRDIPLRKRQRRREEIRSATPGTDGNRQRRPAQRGPPTGPPIEKTDTRDFNPPGAFPAYEI